MPYQSPTAEEAKVLQVMFARILVPEIAKYVFTGPDNRHTDHGNIEVLAAAVGELTAVMSAEIVSGLIEHSPRNLGLDDLLPGNIIEIPADTEVSDDE